jgi:NADPH:quinone reductase-like Zn-dependent oxidoreductase
LSESTNLQASKAARAGEVTRAWLLRRGEDGAMKHAGQLEQATLTLPPLPDDHVLVETLYGSWEGNMTHALERDPIDVCRRLGQDWIVLGNSGVVRVLAAGRGTAAPDEGTLCGFAPIAKQDAHGYVRTVCAYDEPGTMGVLAERFYVRPSQLVALPDSGVVAPVRWASFPVRYTSAWSNWKVALGAWRLQMPDVPPAQTHVWGWGGGVAFAELQLARAAGCNAMMLYTGEQRAEMIRGAGITPVDRGEFPALTKPVPPGDRKAYAEYLKAERAFLNVVDTLTDGARVSIFIDNIGGPVTRPTLRALARQGVIATSGWKRGYSVEYNRAVECIERHTFVHTHASPLQDGLDAMQFARETGWLPPEPDYIYSWDEIPRMADEYAAGRIASYFPTFATAAAKL